MKFYVEVEMDYMEGDAGREFERKIQEKLVERIKGDLQKRVEAGVSNTLNREIESFVTQVLIDFMDKEVKITDCYGKVKETYADMDELIKAKLDKFMSEAVDNNGKPYTGCSTMQHTRYSYMINSSLERGLEVFQKSMNTLFTKKLEHGIKEAKERAMKEAIEKNIDIKSLFGGGAV